MTNDEEQALRQAIVEEAHSWLRTPYIHLGDIKGVGVDCAMLLIRVYCDRGIVPTFDPRPYAPEWYLHQTEERYMGGLEKYSHRIEVPQPGDIALFRFGRTASHGGIVVGQDLMIHADRMNANVELREISSLASRLDSYWSVF